MENFLQLYPCISHIWAEFRAFDSPQKFRDVDIISRVGSPRGKISLTPHP